MSTNVLPRVHHYVGNTAPSLTYTVRKPIAGATDPTDPAQQEPFPFPAGTEVLFYLRPTGSDVFRINGAEAVVVNPAATLPSDANAGKVRYDWTALDVAAPADEFVGFFRLNFPGGTVQDTPDFIWELRDHSTLVTVEPSTGTYTSVLKLKDFTALDSLKLASDEWLAGNVIPRAEAWLLAFGPFLSSTCPQLTLAANMLAEAIFERVNPAAQNAAASGKYKSESIGNYSYTLGDVASSSSGSTAWEDLLEEIKWVLAPCMVNPPGSGDILYGSDQVFAPVPAYTWDALGNMTGAFEVANEIEIIHRYVISPWPGRFRWY